jgi:hypothetical protein
VKGLALVLLAATALIGCSDDDAKAIDASEPRDEPQVIGDVLGPDSSPLSLVSGSTAESQTVVGMRGLTPDEVLWASDIVVQVAGSTAVEIVDAHVQAGPGVVVGDVYVGARNVDGKPGATVGQVPGHELPGEPRRAAGAILAPGDTNYVLYLTVSIAPDATIGSAYGISLDVREEGSNRVSTFTAFSATVLCTTGDVDEPRCTESGDRLGEQIERAIRGA